MAPEITPEEIQTMFLEFRKKFPSEILCCLSAADYLRKRGFAGGFGKFDVDYPIEEPTQFHYWNYLVKIDPKQIRPYSIYHNKVPILDFTAFQFNGQIDDVIAEAPLLLKVGSPLYERYRPISIREYEGSTP
jgi:hypothetical protein